HCVLLFLFLLMPPPPRSTLFPYTTLFRSIFEPFERSENPEALREKGVGLGLAITEALIRILGGDVAVKSELGSGTRFTLRLMLRDRKSTRLNSSHVKISYAVFCLKKKKTN